MQISGFKNLITCSLLRGTGFLFSALLIDICCHIHLEVVPDCSKLDKMTAKPLAIMPAGLIEHEIHSRALEALFKSEMAFM
jgi:hypothetical protein